MARLPRITAIDVIRALERAGFAYVRQRGAHRIFRDSASRRATVPFHKGRIIAPKVLKNILLESGLSTEELIELLKG